MPDEPRRDARVYVRAELGSRSGLRKSTQTNTECQERLRCDAVDVINLQGKIRSLLVLEPRDGDYDALISVFREQDILGKAVQLAGAWSAEVHDGESSHEHARRPGLSNH